MDEAHEGGDCFLAAQGDPAEAFEFVEEALDQIADVDVPVYMAAGFGAAQGILLVIFTMMSLIFATISSTPALLIATLSFSLFANRLLWPFAAAAPVLFSTSPPFVRTSEGKPLCRDVSDSSSLVAGGNGSPTSGSGAAETIRR